jgi:hypothetical protein
MAKLKGGLFPIKGKIDGKVFVHVPGGKSYVRNAVEPGTKKDEPALKEHYVRTPFLNQLATGLVHILSCPRLRLGHEKKYLSELPAQSAPLATLPKTFLIHIKSFLT